MQRRFFLFYVAVATIFLNGCYSYRHSDGVLSCRVQGRVISDMTGAPLVNCPILLDSHIYGERAPDLTRTRHHTDPWGRFAGWVAAKRAGINERLLLGVFPVGYTTPPPPFPTSLRFQVSVYDKASGQWQTARVNLPLDTKSERKKHTMKVNAGIIRVKALPAKLTGRPDANHVVDTESDTKGVSNE